MAAAVKLRTDYSAVDLRRLAADLRRMLTLSDGINRSPRTRQKEQG